MTIFDKKNIICPFYNQAPRIPVARVTLKNDATKKIFVQKLFLYPIATFGKCTEKINFYIPPTLK